MIDIKDPFTKLLVERIHIKSRLGYWGLSHSKLDHLQKKFLRANPQFKTLTDRVADFILKIYKAYLIKRDDKILRWSYIKECFVTNIEWRDLYNSLKWNCFSCRAPIVSKMDEYSIDNFLCEKCKEKQGQISMNYDFAKFTEEFRKKSSIVVNSRSLKMLEHSRKWNLLKDNDPHLFDDV